MPRFEDSLYQGVLTQFSVVDKSTEQLQGVVSAYNAQMESGWVYIAFQRTAGGRRSGQLIHGIFLLIDYLFRTWPFRKVYAELPSYNYDSILADMPSLFHYEGRLKEHLFHMGKYWDVMTVAAYRDQWIEFAGKLWPVLSPIASVAEESHE